MVMHYKETRYGFEYGCAEVERLCSDKRKGWVAIGIKTPKAHISIYITKTGKIRIYDQNTGDEISPANDSGPLRHAQEGASK